MKAIKSIFLLVIAINFLQCSKDKKPELKNYILEDGVYQFEYQTSVGGKGYPLYYIEQNQIYGYYDKRLLCLNKIAGEIIMNEDSITIPSLLWQYTDIADTCAYYSELAGGDIMIFHLGKIKVYSHNDKKALSGRFYYNLFSGVTIGSFNLTYISVK
jgi:hypothetical protein